MERRKIVAGNWKMHKTLEEGLALVTEIKGIVKSECSGKTGVILCPPFIHLSAVSRLLDGSGIELGAQNCAKYQEGAYTGETSAAMLHSTGAKYVILGHSERRQYFSEDAAELRVKIDIAQENGLTPIFCCGETIEQRNAGNHYHIIEAQIMGSLSGMADSAMQNLVIAYEPVWAIGTGVTATPEQANEVHIFIRNLLAQKWNPEIAAQVSILYGGSVKPDNAANIFAYPDIDGGLIGGAALKARDFAEIIKAMDKIQG